MNKILIIGDIHEPFSLDEYLNFCKKMYVKYKCNKVIFIGDIIDAHAWSDYPSDPDGLSSGDEIELAVTRLKRWYKAFPDAIVTMGNHDYRISKKAYKNGLSKRFVKDFGDVLEAPKGWKFVEEVEIDGVLYTHGSSGDAFKRAKDMRMSVVQGHLHSKSFIEYSTSSKDTIFGMNVGCGIDAKKYAFSYGKDMAKKPIINIGIVIENIPHIIPFYQ